MARHMFVGSDSPMAGSIISDWESPGLQMQGVELLSCLLFLEGSQGPGPVRSWSIWTPPEADT